MGKMEGTLGRRETEETGQRSRIGLEEGRVVEIQVSDLKQEQEELTGPSKCDRARPSEGPLLSDHDKVSPKSWSFEETKMKDAIKSTLHLGPSVLGIASRLRIRPSQYCLAT